MTPILYAEEREVRARLLMHIHTGELTIEEAAQSFAGWRLKQFEAQGRQLSPGVKDAMARESLVDLASRLPCWQGLSLHQHFQQS